jgi:hypothetical protein
MLKHLVFGIQHSGETYEQFCEREKRWEEENAEVDRQLEAWKPGPAKFYRNWIEKHAPHLLKENK